MQATDAEILAACREWVELVAEGRLDDAIEMLHVPDRYDASQHWTAASLRTYVGNYGSWNALPGGRTVAITSMANARRPVDRPTFEPRAEVVRRGGDGASGSAELDLPLDGAWSDLTARFEFDAVPGGIALALYDLHVL